MGNSGQEGIRVGTMAKNDRAAEEKRSRCAQYGERLVAEKRVGRLLGGYLAKS